MKYKFVKKPSLIVAICNLLGRSRPTLPQVSLPIVRHFIKDDLPLASIFLSKSLILLSNSGMEVHLDNSSDLHDEHKSAHSERETLNWSKAAN